MFRVEWGKKNESTSINILRTKTGFSNSVHKTSPAERLPTLEQNSVVLRQYKSRTDVLRSVSASSRLNWGSQIPEISAPASVSERARSVWSAFHDANVSTKWRLIDWQQIQFSIVTMEHKSFNTCLEPLRRFRYWRSPRAKWRRQIRRSPFCLQSFLISRRVAKLTAKKRKQQNKIIKFE